MHKFYKIYAYHEENIKKRKCNKLINNPNVKECILFSQGFKPTNEFEELIKSLGYNFAIDYFDIMFDKKVIKFVKEHVNYLTNSGKAYKGRETLKHLIEFAGLCIPAKVDTSKKNGLLGLIV